MAETPSPPRPKPIKPCPVCGRPADPTGRFKPFCSARCRQVDLGRWLAGDYAIPDDAPLPEDDSES